MLVYEAGDRKMNLSAERGDGMLNYLEQGMILYVMAAVCAIGVISRMAANHFYKSLIRQSDNLAAAKDKQLQQMKTKYESIYRMNCGMKNTEVFVNKMQQQYRVAGIRLSNWENCSIYSAVAAFLIGAVSALVLYMNEGSARMCILYLAGGSLMAAGMIMLSGLMGSNANREMLENGLIHYFENVLVVRSARDMPDGLSEEEPEEMVQTEREAIRSSAAARTRGVMRDDIFMQKKETAQKERNESAERNAATEREEKRGNRPELVRKEEDADKNRQKQLEELKESLAQIAAARGESGDRQAHKQQTRKLSPKEEQLINDIISQYLS